MEIEKIFADILKALKDLEEDSRLYAEESTNPSVYFGKAEAFSLAADVVKEKMKSLEKKP